MKYKLLKDLYDYFYTPPELSAQKQEIEECHRALSEALGKLRLSQRLAKCSVALLNFLLLRREFGWGIKIVI